jgi:tetratricopeptide (TPR) repeat protein
MLGAIMMGGGWWQEKHASQSALLPVTPEAARSAAVFSAISGAFGLWVSAASMLPPIALVGISGVLALMLHGRSAVRGGTKFDPQVWRTWGRVGASMSFAFYLLEYFPGHLGLRLEANHPLYAIAWCGAGELLARFSERWLSLPNRHPLSWWQMAWPLAALAAAPLVIFVKGTKVFIVLDPFLARLHSDYIQEFLPIWRVLRGATAPMFFQIVLLDNLPLVAGFATLTFLRRDAPIILWFATLAGFLFNLMAWWQSRWMLNASGVQVCLAIVLFACWTKSAKPLTRWIAALALVGALYGPNCVARIKGAANEVSVRRVAPRDATNILYRDIAAALRASQPTGEITLLASPNGSTGIGYYGRFKTIGTLYWENRDGLKSAAAIFSAKSEAEAQQLIRKHHVTHIAIVSEENFIQQYFELLHPGATADQIKQGLGYRLLVEKNIPQWLEIIPYRMPDDLSSLPIVVLLFKVNFEQNMAEALYHVALAQAAQGEIDAADRTLDLLISKAPLAYQPWLRKADLLLARHRWGEAAEAAIKGIALAPAAERPGLSTLTAKSFYDQQQHAIAVRIYQAAMRDRPTADNACYLAWILATSKDASIRNGAEALKLAQAAVSADPNSPTYLESLAAALAENGRFNDAVAAADRALANSRLGGAAGPMQQIFAERVEQLKSAKPLRY